MVEVGKAPWRPSGPIPAQAGGPGPLTGVLQISKETPQPLWETSSTVPLPHITEVLSHVHMEHLVFQFVSVTLQEDMRIE